jgi:hypothetical protein
MFPPNKRYREIPTAIQDRSFNDDGRTSNPTRSAGRYACQIGGPNRHNAGHVRPLRRPPESSYELSRREMRRPVTSVGTRRMVWRFGPAYQWCSGICSIR